MEAMFPEIILPDFFHFAGTGHELEPKI